MCALLLQRDSLVNAEPVLLVDDGEREIGELHALLHERMGADDQVDRSAPDRIQDPPAVSSRHRCREERVGDGPLRRGRLRLAQQALLAGAVGTPFRNCQDVPPSHRSEERLHS